jgi:hypothetical protein
MTIICDWITISQKHHDIGDIPNFSDGRVLSLSNDGQVDWLVDRSAKHEGSYDTRLLIRAIGNQVDVSGNVGAWSRPDNVRGYTFAETLVKLNQIMVELGLPEFTKGEQYIRANRTHDRFKRVFTGASISRLDLTKNYETGSLANADEYLFYLGGVRATRMKTSVMGHQDTLETIAHGQNSKYRSAIIYNKAREFRKHKKQFLDDPDSYHSKLLEYLEANGIIRFELRLKQRWLTQKRLRYLGEIQLSDLENAFNEAAETIITSANVDRQHDLSNPAYMSFTRWKDGCMLQKNRTYYRHRREILDVMGIDISNPLQSRVLQFPLRVRVIEIAPATQPIDYYLPQIAL